MNLKNKNDGTVYNWFCSLHADRHQLLLVILRNVSNGLKTCKTKRRKRFMYTALFIVGLIMFGYLMYVLVKPEKF